MKTKPCPICKKPLTPGRRFGAHLEKHERDEIKKGIALRVEAIRLFRIVNGPNSSKAFEWLPLELQDGWLRLATEMKRK